MIRRRDFLGTSIAGGVGVMAAPAWARASATGAAATVSESFVFPEWLTATAAAISTDGDRGDRAYWRAFLDLRAGIEAGQTAVGVTLVSLPAPGVELFPPGQAADMARLANDRLAERVLGAGNSLIGLATVAASDPKAAQEAERALGKPGLSGLALGANRRVRLDDRSLWPVYEVAQALGAPIYLPASYAPMVGDVPYRALGAPGILAGAAAESARHANQLIFGGVLDAFPALNVVLGRLGEATPYWHSELAETFSVLKGAGAATPKRYLDGYFTQNIMLTTADIVSAHTVQFCASIVGAGRVLQSQDQIGPAAWARGRPSFRA